MRCGKWSHGSSIVVTGVAMILACGCSKTGSAVRAADSGPATRAAKKPGKSAGAEADGIYRGFDRNDYPGDDAMAGVHKSFSFTGYWLTNPPGENNNSWVGKRGLLRGQGWGFLVLANGRLDAEILKAQKHGTPPAALGRADAANAVAAAQHEGFAAQTILFLDQEEGGRMLDEQAAYLLAWTEAVSGGGYRAGTYASGQPVPDGLDAQGRAATITTIEDLRARVAAGHLRPIAFFDAQDSCPPAPGCSLQAKPLTVSGERVVDVSGDLVAWQYAQSPRRPEITKACAATYAKDGNCYAPGFPTVFLDMDMAGTPDPSHGR